MIAHTSVKSIRDCLPASDNLGHHDYGHQDGHRSGNAIHRPARLSACVPLCERRRVELASTWEECMSYRDSLFVVAALVTLSISLSNAQAHDESKYPNWKGQWSVILTPGLGGQNVKFDPIKAWGKSQGAPLTPEYQKVHEDSMADQANGGLGNYPTAHCYPRHAAHDVDRTIRIRHRVGHHLSRSAARTIIVESSPTGRPWPSTSIRPTQAIDRPMDRRGRRRPLRHTRGRDAWPVQGTPRLRRHRAAAALRQ